MCSFDGLSKDDNLHIYIYLKIRTKYLFIIIIIIIIVFKNLRDSSQVTNLPNNLIPVIQDTLLTPVANVLENHIRTHFWSPSINVRHNTGLVKYSPARIPYENLSAQSQHYLRWKSLKLRSAPSSQTPQSLRPTIRKSSYIS